MRPEPPAGQALFFPRCRSVHTFGMRFPIDVVFLDHHAQPIETHAHVVPNRVLTNRRARHVIETPAGQAWIIHAMAQEPSSKLVAALDPRQPIYRDTYNEYFVLLLSIGGAVAGTQVPLYILMAITGTWNVAIFVGACVIFELAVIFGLARPQMKPQERAGWVVLWGITTAIMAVLFYYLIAEPTLG